MAHRPIEYLDAASQVVGRVETGLPHDLAATQEVLEATEGLSAIADRLHAEDKIGAGLLAMARAVGRGEQSAESLIDRLSALQRPLLEYLSSHQTQTASHIVSNMTRFGAGPDKCINTFFEGVRKGAVGWAVIRRAAATLDNMHESAIARELVDAAILVAPTGEFKTGCQYTKALIESSLGSPIGAKEATRAFGNWLPCGKRFRRAQPALWPSASS